MISNKRRNSDFSSRRARRKQSKVDNDVVDADDATTQKGDIDQEEKELESFLFGGMSAGSMDNDQDTMTLEDGNNVNNDNGDDDDQSPLLSFEINTKPGETLDFCIDTGKSVVDVTPTTEVIQLDSKSKKAAAWVDPDDEEVVVNIKNNKSLRKLREEDDDRDVSGTKFQERLKTNFEKVMPAPAWADLTNAGKEGTEDDDEEDRIFKSSKKLLAASDMLPKGLLNIKRLKDLNKQKPSNATITNLKFHPSAKIALTASLNKNLNIFQVDGKENEKLQSIFLTDFPIHCAHFTPTGNKVICSGRRKFFYVYDMIGGDVTRIPGIRGRDEKSLENFTVSPDGELLAFMGDSGYVNLVSSKTYQWISSLKMNGRVSTAAFSPDSSRLYTTGRDGEVYIWDVKSRRCLHRFIDDGSTLSTSIGISSNGKYVAVGSSSGVVNIYDEKCFTSKSPSPLKAVMNLTTKVEGSVFNSTNEVLACYSPQVRNAMKLIHLPSLTAFSNWPIEKQTLGNIQCVDFSPKSGYLGIGNESGKALLFRLNHFPDS